MQSGGVCGLGREMREVHIKFISLLLLEFCMAISNFEMVKFKNVLNWKVVLLEFRIKLSI